MSFSVEILRTIFVAPLLVLTALATSHAEAQTSTQPTGQSRVFYHSRKTSISRNLGTSVFEGDVVAIGGGTVVTADRIEVSEKSDSMHATGHVIILTPRQVFLGDDLTFQWSTGDFRILNAVMISHDPKEVERVSQRLLGFTPEELVFEAKRNERLDRMGARKSELREEWRSRDWNEQGRNDDLVDAYALLLEREELTRDQQNPELAKMSKARRSAYLVRREYWKETVAAYGTANVSKEIYFRVTGDVIERTNGNDYKALDATFTTCKCEEDESPAWGFQADRIEAQVEGYVDLVHPVLQIKGIPILYLPYLKMPIKQQRQSGFLVPNFRTGDRRTGTVYTQPVFFAFAPNADATVTTDIFEERGTRLGVEMRYEQRQDSGWRLNVETMRDRQWLSDLALRRRLRDFHANDPAGCRNLPTTDPNYCSPELYQSRLATPSDTWRGKTEWQGATFFAPRLSLVSKGEIVSDRRYLGELSMGDSFEEIFNPGKYAQAYSMAKSRIHLDGRDMYLGVGSSLGDHALVETNRFDGLQMPFHLNIQSRYYALLEGRTFPIPLYVQGGVQHIPIQDFTTAEALDKPVMGSGEWRRSHVNFVAPLVREGLVRVDSFVEGENRAIQHRDIFYESERHDSSWIQSWRTGLSLNLPIDGEGELPEWFQPDDYRESERGRRYLHHIMNWRLLFSARPSVVRRGPYGTIDPATGYRRVYFASDRMVYDTSDQAATVEESMLKHQRITFSTTHRWRIFRRGWKALEPSQMPARQGEQKPPESFREKARRELEYSMDRQVASDREMFSEENGLNWFITRYHLTEFDAQEPINFSSDITFDFEQERLRREQIRRNGQLEAEGRDQEVVHYSELPRAWTGPNASLAIGYAGFGLTNQVEYDLYLRTSRKMGFALGLPEVVKTSFSLGVSLDKQPQFDKESDQLRFAETVNQTVTVVTGLIPRIRTTASYGLKTTRYPDKTAQLKQYETRFGLEYYDPSECWGIRFLRSKNYEYEHERQAHYLLQLTILFMGQSRGLDISAPVEKRYHQES